MSKKEQTSDNQQTDNSSLGVVSISYGFQVGEHIIEIEADSEKEAMQKLVSEFWDFIDTNGKVELLGGREK